MPPRKKSFRTPPKKVGKGSGSGTTNMGGKKAAPFAKKKKGR